MRYQCQCYRDERKLSGLSALELEKLRAAAEDYLAQLPHPRNEFAPASSFRHCDVLSAVLCDGSVVAMDGPIQSTQISKDTFFTIEARDLNECLRIVSLYPLLQLGGIEIRPG